MNLSNIEKETVITYNEQEKTAVVYTCSPSLIRRLEGLTTARPDECRLLRRMPDGVGIEYEVPKKWVKVSPPRFVSEETRAAAAERFRNAQLARSSQAVQGDSGVNQAEV